MKFTLMLNRGEYQDYIDIARTAETAGFHDVAVSDSIFFPVSTNSIYPYADTGDIRAYIDTVPFIEPFVAMAWMAAVTTRLNFFPSVLKVPVRQPLLIAKSLTSLATISAGRVSFGAGVSPWREDFVYNGMNFERRGEMMDECVAIIRGMMSGQYFEYHGKNYDFGPIKMNPVPAKPVPILFGGHSRVALRRAARIGDGWISCNTDYESIRAMIAELNGFRREYGCIDRPDFAIHVNDIEARTLDDFRRLRDLGATNIFGVQSADTPQQTIDDTRRFGDEIISRMD